MSAVAPRPATLPAARALVAEWTISRAALHAAGLAAAKGPDGVFRWRVRAIATAELVVDGQAREVAAAAAAIEHDGEWTHVTTAGGELRATFDDAGQAAYAVTTVPASLGVAGGRYERA